MKLKLNVLIAICLLLPPVICFLPSSVKLTAATFYLPLCLFLFSLGITWNSFSFRKCQPMRSLFRGGLCAIGCLAVIPISYRYSVSFTYGSLQDSPELFKKILLQSIPSTFLLSWLGWEWSLRHVFWIEIRKRFPPLPTLLITGVAGTYLQVCPLFLSPGFDERYFFWPSLLELFSLQLLLGTLRWTTGGIFSGAICLGILRSMELYLLGDELSPYLPLRNYVSSSLSFYLLKASVPGLMALGIYLWKCRSNPHSSMRDLQP